MRFPIFLILQILLIAGSSALAHANSAGIWPFRSAQAIGFIAFGAPLPTVKPAPLHLAREQCELDLQPLTGQAILSRLKIIPFSYFQSLAPENAEAMYQKYLTEIAERAFGQLILEKILDHETLRLHPQLKSPNEVPLARIHYILQTVLLTFQQPKTSLHTPSPVLADLNALFEELKKAVGTQPVRFNIDWNECEGPLQSYCRQFRSHRAWPPLTIDFKIFPTTLGELSDALEEKLESSAASLQRNQTWQRLHAERSAALGPLNPPFRIEEFRAEYHTLVKDPYKAAHRLAGENLSSFETAWQSPKTRDLLIAQAKASRAKERERKLLLQLYSENPFLAAINLCPSSERVCLHFDPDKMASLLSGDLNL